MEMMRGLVVASALLLGASCAGAQELAVLSMLRPARGSFAPPPPALAVKYQRVEVEIADHAVVTRVRQQFRNGVDAVLEGEYRFTLPPEASVSDFAIWDGERRVAGVVRRREEARAIYDAIVTQRRDPGLLEQVAPSTFSARVFPIPPLAEKKIEIEYRESLRVEDGLACYRYPLASARHAAVDELVVTLDIADGAEVASAWSPTPGVAIHHHDAHRVTASYESAHALPEGDLLIYYTVKRPRAGMQLAAHRADASRPGYFQLAIAPPDEAVPPVAKDVVFVLDTSGSMVGPKIQQAKRALSWCVKSLRPDDRFEMLRFSSDVEPWSTRLVPVTGEHLQKALRWIASLEPAGGTNIDEALSRALSTFLQESTERPRYVVFLTDGDPTEGEREPSRIVAHVHDRNLVHARLFTFGIDEAAGSPLLDQLAAGNRGESISVGARDDLSTDLPRFFGKLTAPLFEDAVLSWQGVVPHEVHPSKLPPFYLGRQLTVWGRYREPGAGQVTLTARVNDRPVRYTLPVSLPSAEPSHAALPRLWAQAAVQSLLSEHPTLPAELKEEVIRLSIEHRFATPFTSFIAVPDAERDRLPESLKRLLDGPVARVTPQGGTREGRLTLDGTFAETPRPEAPPPPPRPRPRPHPPIDEATKRRISNVTSQIIEESEDDQLTDEKVERYARQFEKMLGGKPGEKMVLTHTMRDTYDAPARRPMTSTLPFDANKGVGSIQGGARLALAPTAKAPAALPEGMDRRYRELQQEVASLRTRLRMARARLAALKSHAPAPFLQSFRVEPVLVAGGASAKLAVTLGGAPGARIRWSCREGRLTDTSETGATWEAPYFPGIHEIRLQIFAGAAPPVEAILEVVVFEPGDISYAPDYLAARFAELESALTQLRAEHAALLRELGD